MSKWPWSKESPTRKRARSPHQGSLTDVINQMGEQQTIAIMEERARIDAKG